MKMFNSAQIPKGLPRAISFPVHWRMQLEKHEQGRF